MARVLQYLCISVRVHLWAIVDGAERSTNTVEWQHDRGLTGTQWVDTTPRGNQLQTPWSARPLQFALYPLDLVVLYLMPRGSYQDETNITAGRIDQTPSTITPSVRRRRPAGAWAPLPPRGGPIPTPHEQALEQMMGNVEKLLEQSQAYLRSQLQASVQTLDTIVFEHDTQELPTGQSWFTLSLVPQTRQMELITGLFCAVTVPTPKTAAPTITIENAYAELGSDYVNLNAILNSLGSTGGSLPGNYAFLLNADAPRNVNLVASGDWPQGAFLTFCLFGTTVPAMFGEVLT